MQANGVRFLTAVYGMLFLVVAVLVLWEGVTTEGWSGKLPAHSVLIGVAALNGWFVKAFAMLNVVFGFGGGLFCRDDTAPASPAPLLQGGLMVLMGGLIVVSLLALWTVASSYANILEKTPDFAGISDLKVGDAIAAIGTLNLGLAGGFLAGLAIPPKQVP
jgi:hypothetical protein